MKYVVLMNGIELPEPIEKTACCGVESFQVTRSEMYPDGLRWCTGCLEDV